MKLCYFVLPAVMALVQPLHAEENEIQLTNADDLFFSEKDNLETVCDKNGNPFSGAVRKKDDEGRTITYFYRNGLRNGVITSKYEDGKLEFEITYRKGKKDGEEIYFYENGNPKHKKTYKENVLNGEETLFYENGKPQLQNHYVNGKKNGETTYFDENGNRTKIEHFKDDIKDGVEHIISDNSLVEENHYTNGVLNGVTKKYNKEYQTDEIEYADGKKNGIARHFNKDGSTTEVPYVNDQKNGTGVAYYPDKKIANKAEYRNDMKNGMSLKYYKNGKRQLAETYKNDKPEGISRTFTQDGELKSVSYYVDGMELAVINLEQDSELRDIAAANRMGQISKYTSKKAYWYPVLWLGLNSENLDILQNLEKDMKMYGAALDDMAVYQRESKSKYADYNRRLFFGLMPLSYAVDLSAPLEILQKFTAPQQINGQNPRGGTALQEAIRLNNPEMVKFLLLHKADISSSPKIFLQSVKEGVAPEILEELLKAGADVNAADANGENSAVWAVKHNDLQLLNLLQKYHADFQTLLPDGKNLLFYAVNLRCDESVINALLAAGLDINQPDKNGSFLLLNALKSKDYELTEKLLKLKADVNMTDSSNESAVSFVLENSVPPKIFKKVMAKKVDTSRLFGKQHKPLWRLAAEAEQYELLKRLFDKTGGADKPDAQGVAPIQTIVNVKNIEDSKVAGIILSYISSQWLNEHPQYWQQVLDAKNLQLFQKLVEIGFNPNVKNANGEEPALQLVKSNDSLVWLEALEKLNPNLNISDASGKTLLQYAIDYNNLDMARNLLEHGVSVSLPQHNYLPELKSDKTAITELLLSKGADTSYIAPDGRTLLMIAVQNLNLSLAEHLLQNGADTKARDKNGNIALFYIAEALKENQNLEQNKLLPLVQTMVQKLLQYGIDINTQNGNGETVLIYAAKIKVPYYTELLKILAEQGIDAGVKDQYGKTAADYAK